MCSAPNVYMFVYILIGTHMVPLTQTPITFLIINQIKRVIPCYKENNKSSILYY